MYKQIVLVGLSLMLVTGFMGIAEAVTISFEQSEGFPAPSGIFNNQAIPAGIVSSWKPTNNLGTIRSSGIGSSSYSGDLLPVNADGSQAAAIGWEGVGTVSITMDLVDSARLSLTSFYWAYRGNGNSRCDSEGIGGPQNAFLDVTYYDLNGNSLGTDTFCGGLSPSWDPQFTLATPSIQGVPLSKVLFEMAPPFGSGNFYIDRVGLTPILFFDLTTITRFYGAFVKTYYEGPFNYMNPYPNGYFFANHDAYLTRPDLVALWGPESFVEWDFSILDNGIFLLEVEALSSSDLNDVWETWIASYVPWLPGPATNFDTVGFSGAPVFGGISCVSKGKNVIHVEMIAGSGSIIAASLTPVDETGLCGIVGEQVDAMVVAPDGGWKNHGQYVSAVAHATDETMAGLTCLSDEEYEEIHSCVVSERAGSRVGKKDNQGPNKP